MKAEISCQEVELVAMSSPSQVTSTLSVKYRIVIAHQRTVEILKLKKVSLQPPMSNEEQALRITRTLIQGVQAAEKRLPNYYRMNEATANSTGGIFRRVRTPLPREEISWARLLSSEGRAAATCLLFNLKAT